MTGKEEQIIRKTVRDVGRAINTWGLIKEGDVVAVAMSGGKDSYVLLETLALRKRHIPIDYTLHAVHVNIRNIPYETDCAHLESFCTGLGVPFHYRELEIELRHGDTTSPCFTCSWHRRRELFRFCDEHRCGRLALGHHRDDVVETFLMNMLFQGSLSAMPPRLPLFDGTLEIIRPLYLLWEEQIGEYARIRRFPPQQKECPYGKNSKRERVREILRDMEKQDRQVKNSIFRALSNRHEDYLP